MRRPTIINAAAEPPRIALPSLDFTNHSKVVRFFESETGGPVLGTIDIETRLPQFEADFHELDAEILCESAAVHIKLW